MKKPENTMLDYIESPEDMTKRVISDIYRQEMRGDVQEAMNVALTEQDTVKAYFWHGATLERIARQKNVTIERVRQQLAKAERKLSRGKAVDRVCENREYAVLWRLLIL